MSYLRGNAPRMRTALTNTKTRRLLHDLTTFGPSYKPTIAYGVPGRSADTGHVATVFGCTGFLGRYLVHKLAKEGTQVIVPYRDEDQKRHLKVMGDLGQIVSLEWDIRNEEQIVECMRHSDIVYNLVGRDYETKNFTYEDVHVNGPAMIARLATQLGIPRFVHVSHLNASRDSKSAFYRTKYEGEERVRQEFGMASIVRPAIMYGPEDKLLNNMAFWSIWWHLNHGETKVRPAHVLDVAQALHNLIDLPPQRQLYSLPGPRTYTYEELLELVASVTYNPPSSAPTLPKRVATLLARVAQAAWWPMICPDEVERRYINDMSEKEVSGDWSKLGIDPDVIETHALQYLKRYRSAENYSRPLVLPSERRASAASVKSLTHT